MSSKHGTEMKGFLSYLVLWILRKKNMNGAEISDELENRKGSKPSPGTIYPALKELREKGLIECDNSKVYSLTEDGEKEVKCLCSHFCKVFYDMQEMFKCCHTKSEADECGCGKH